MEMLSLEKELSENAYPGRGIVIGVSEDGKKAVTAYFIMGRSSNSRNRVFVTEGEGIRTEAFDPSKLEDPSLIIYAPVRVLGNKTIVTNGDQTDTIYDGLDDELTFEQSLRSRQFEPDGPNYTPRISGVMHIKNGVFDYSMSILKSNNGNPAANNRYTFSYENPVAGEGHFIHTYMHDGNPLPSFEGEPKWVKISGDIDYVVNEEQPKLYLVEGHGEADLPSTFAEQVEKDNIETESLSLLHTETIPEDADCLMIYAPESDISEDERDLLAEYVSGGGKLLVIAGPTREDGILENLYSLLSDYGVEPVEGIVVESDSDYYSAFSGPAALLPELHSDDITDSLIDSNYSVIMPIALGLTVDGSASGTVTELLTTSGTSFSKAAGYAMSTYDHEDGDIDGPFATGVSVRPGDGEMVWFTSSYFLEDAYNASSSGANGDLVMNALADMIGESEAMAIRSKSLNYDNLSISSSTASLLKVLMIGAFPLAYLGIGVGVVLTRRRKQNEAV